ncbi:phage tail protein [Citrobacter sp. HN-141]|uniref:phage tail protein n=1 Tax=unclassified Citrobacter TaxID=2644389 RepID=UPI0029650DA9|nr:MULTISPECIES: phage tail protein [unclassified Citrobacter]MDW2645993.1 phage tail protein [Citrobacter sp. HN-141]MDW2655509.1 phage tail protein [Citrobacter sp. HN-120]MDW2698534.1 phage tail protein [Citrobacter sp. HN-144]
MIKDWLKKQLIPEKQETGLWPDFADAVQVVYEDEVKPLLSRLSDRKSFFTMHSEDLDTRISEYGRFFVMGETDKASRPILLAQRLDEVHFKGTDRPIISTFWREFGNLPVNWEPLYAPLDQERFPYGTFFTTENGVKVAQESYGDFFLTSRGTINVDLNKLYEIYGYEEQDKLIKRLIKDVDRIVAPLLPLETVFDGISLRLDFWLEEAEEVMKYASATVGSSRAFLFQPFRESIELQYVEASYDAGEITPQTCSQDSIYLRLDTMPVDAWPLDLHILNRG